MSKESLEHLRDYIQLTLSPHDISWLLNELGAKSQKQETLKPYTMDEINAMIDEGERQIANGEYPDFDEAMAELEREFAEEDRLLEMAETTVV